MISVWTVCVCACATGSTGRVDRLGQTKPTFVHRFIAQESIEDTILRLNRQTVASLQEGFVLASKTPTGSGAEDTVSREDVLALITDVETTLKRVCTDCAGCRPMLDLRAVVLHSNECI